MTQVLVADDDSGTRAMLRDVLEGEGYTVITARNGRAALAHMRMTPMPLVVLLDERMPGLTGTEVVGAYRAGTPTSRREFILLTASPDALPAVFDGHVPVVAKPFNLGTLLGAVARAAARLEGQ
jgi:CheY-like chemotaxis protein